MKYNRYNFQTVKINDSLALIMGGFNDLNQPISKCELINIKSKTIKEVQQMNYNRAYFKALLDKNNNVIAIGGYGADKHIERYNYKKDEWEIIGNLKEWRAQHTAAFLNDSIIMVLGGITQNAPIGSSSFELFNLNSGQTEYINNYIFQVNGINSLQLSNNNVIVFGGREGGANSIRTNFIHKYNFNNYTWSNFGLLYKPTYMITDLALPNNEFLLTGGSYKEAPFDFSNYYYYIKNENISNRGTLISERVWHRSEQFNQDSIIIFGGYNNNDVSITNCEWLNLGNFKVSPAPSLITGRRYFQSVSFNGKNGNVILAIAGYNEKEASLSSIEILESDSIVTNNPPQITDMQSGCGFFSYIVEDPNYIDQIFLNNSNSKNCEIEILDKLPSKKVKVNVKLIDKKINGYFEIINKSSKTGLDYIIRHNISSISQFNDIITIDTLDDDGFYNFGEALYGTIKQFTISLKNLSINNYTTNQEYYFNNKSFTTPLSEFPFSLKSGSINAIKIIVQFNHVGEFTDTLMLNFDSCAIFLLPLKAKGLKEDFKSYDKCNNNLKLITIAIENKKIFIENIYPNPAVNNIKVSIFNMSEKITNIFLQDILGNSYEVEDYSVCNYISNNSQLFINLSNFKSGFYNLIIKTDSNYLSKPIIIN